MKRTTSLPTSSTTSASVTKSPARLRHLHRLAAAEQPHHLDQLDVEVDAAVGQRLHRRLHALDRAGMVGAPDVDQMVGVLGLLPVIGGVGAEIGPAAVRLLHRPVLVVAELRRAEQGQLDRLPFVVRVEALGPLERAFVDEALGAQHLHRLLDRAALLQLGLGREQVVVDAEQAEIVPDQVEHRLDRRARGRRAAIRLRACRRIDRHTRRRAIVPTGFR